MKGGDITVALIFQLATGASSSVQVHLDGGTITAGSFTMKTGASMDLEEGVLIIDGDQVSTVQGYIDSGWITAYGGVGELDLDYDITNPGKTTLKAVCMLNPNPAPGSTVPVTLNQLQWKLLEPSQPGGVVTCDVYFGTDADVEANPKVVLRQAVESVSVVLARDTVYYWAIDVWDSSVSTTEPSYLSPKWSFNTNNTVPVVNAGDDVATWLVNGSSVVQLEGAVSDDGLHTLLWTVIAEPNTLNPAEISNPLVLNPTVTVRELGSYALQLEATDIEFTVADTMRIVLYADACEHAKHQAGFELMPGDINEDCKVDLLDMAILAEAWVQSNYSTK